MVQIVRSYSRIAAGFCLGLILSSCAHYYLPANRLESPEARGIPGLGRLDPVGIQSGPDLTAPSRTKPVSNGDTSPPTQELQKSYLNPLLGFTYAALDKAEVGFKLQPYAPVMLKGKYQFVGEPEVRASAQNISVAVVAAVGTLIAQDTGYTLFEVEFPAGYRFNSSHLVILTPLLSSASLSIPKTAVNSDIDSANQTGIAVGYQYTLEDLHFRLEISKVSGTAGPYEHGGIYPALALGLRL